LMMKLKTIVMAILLLTTSVFADEYRSIDGSGNNIANPTWGKAEIEYSRLTTNGYDDGLSVPRGDSGSPMLPSARVVSNAVSAQSGLVPNTVHATDWVWQWGQFIDHDIDLTVGASPAEPFNIAVPSGDAFFDPGKTGTQEIGLDRSRYVVDGNSVRQQLNDISSYLDGSMVYGSDTDRATEIRTLDGTGSLKTSSGDLLPFNVAGLPNAGGTGSSLFIAGDIRANEQVALTATHTLFMREHNRLVDQLNDRLNNPITAQDTELADKFTASGLSQGDFVYESARKIVGAEIQIVTYNEFIPTVLGTDANALSPFTAYDSTVNVAISNEFATAAYRFGHSMLSPDIQRVDNDGFANSHISMSDAFFDPTEITANGIDTLLKGLASQEAQDIDTLIDGGVRNFLFGPPGSGGYDLAALNLQRGREHGMLSLNDFREEFLGAGSAHENFLDITGGNVDLAIQFASVYDTVDDVDLWIGGLAEVHVNGGMVGETFFEIMTDQFGRTRDGDRFFYLNELDDLSILAPDILSDTTLANVIRRNSSISNIQDNVFLLSVPLPATAWLILPFLGWISVARSMRPRRVA